MNTDARSPLLQVRGLSAWWGQAQALFGVDLEVHAGELVVLQGLNGAGKSTLLQSICGLCERQTGEISYENNSIATWPPHRRAQAGIGFVAEDRRLFAALSVRENLHIAARGDVQAREREVLTLFAPLAKMLGRRVTQMSGGEQQMLAVARTLMTGPRLLLLDEPCEGIAPILVEAMRDALLALRTQGMALLVAEHNELLVAHADRRVELVAGQVAASSVPTRLGP